MLTLSSSCAHLILRKLIEMLINTKAQFSVLTDFDGCYSCSETAFTMKSLHVIAVVLGILIAQSHEGESFRMCLSQICSSNPSNEIRGWDPQGNGKYGASRKSQEDRYPHKGIDIVCNPGSDIHSPIPATITRVRTPLENNEGRVHNVGVLMRGRGIWSAYDVTLFYVKIKDELIGTEVDQNTVIGEMTDMAKEYESDGDRGMTNHVHLQLELHRRAGNDRYVDPTRLRCRG